MWWLDCQLHRSTFLHRVWLGSRGCQCPHLIQASLLDVPWQKAYGHSRSAGLSSHSLVSKGGECVLGNEKFKEKEKTGRRIELVSQLTSGLSGL